MNEVQPSAYVAAFALGMGDGVTLERYRAPRGGIHKMRLVHHDSGVSVERKYDDREKVHAVLKDLIGQLQARLCEKGLRWLPGQQQ